MSYVDEVFDLVVAKNPAQPEFHQAVKEVLESLRVVIEANEEKYRKDALLERLVTPERQILFRAHQLESVVLATPKYDASSLSRFRFNAILARFTISGTFSSVSVCFSFMFLFIILFVNIYSYVTASYTVFCKIIQR